MKSSKAFIAGSTIGVFSTITVGGYAIMEAIGRHDVIMHAVLDTIAVKIDKKLYGDSPVGRYSRPSYNRTKHSDVILSKEDIDVENVIVGNKQEAGALGERLLNLIKVYNKVTVLDLYELLGFSGTHKDATTGWTNLDTMSWTVTNHGYQLNLPKPELLK